MDDDELIEKLMDGMSGTFEKLALMIERDVVVAEAEVNWAIKRKIKDDDYIEQLFEKLLDVAGMNDNGFEVFKRLCRYYYHINPELTVEYANIYRDLYDSDDTSDDDEDVEYDVAMDTTQPD